MGQLARFNPIWIEEPTSADDIQAHADISKVMIQGYSARTRLPRQLSVYFLIITRFLATVNLFFFSLPKH